MAIASGGLTAIAFFVGLSFGVAVYLSLRGAYAGRP
jgi:hypothetical protein